jgi:hypothetical protein
MPKKRGGTVFIPIFNKIYKLVAGVLVLFNRLTSFSGPEKISNGFLQIPLPGKH